MASRNLSIFMFPVDGAIQRGIRSAADGGIDVHPLLEQFLDLF